MTEGQRGTGADVLDRIVAAKTEEVTSLRRHRAALERAASDAPPARPVRAPLEDRRRVAVIAEVKRKSPGAGAIDLALDPATLAVAYEAGGAFAISVLTDGPFFGGALSDLTAVRAAVSVPVLRKDFVVDEIQVFEARAAGADLVLLIVRILEPAALARLRALIEELGMTALVEVHGEDEVAPAVDSGATLVGVNNRDLATFTTDLTVTARLASRLPSSVAVVSESGIATPADVSTVAGAGADAVLVGEALVRSPSPAGAVAALAGVERRGRRSA